MKKIPIFFTLFLFIMPSFAAEIDLSSFASGDASTHSHIWVDKYDAEYHWQECSLCSLRQGQSEHSGNYSYTITEHTCDNNNKRVFTCDGCNYSHYQTYTTKSHVLNKWVAVSHANWNPSEPTRYTAIKYCINCNKQYGEHGHVYDSSGNVIEYITSTPTTVYFEDGTSQTIYHISDKYMVGDFTNELSVEYSPDYSTATIIAILNVPAYVIEMEGVPRYSRILVGYLTEAYPSGSQYVYNHSDTYIPGSKTFTMTFTVDIRDWTEDALNFADIYLCPVFDYELNGNTHELVVQGNNIQIDNPLAATTITEVISS